MLSVTTEPSDERNLSPGFIQLRTPARINIYSVTQQPPCYGKFPFNFKLFRSVLALSVAVVSALSARRLA